MFVQSCDCKSYVIYVCISLSSYVCFFSFFSRLSSLTISLASPESRSTSGEDWSQCDFHECHRGFSGSACRIVVISGRSTQVTGKSLTLTHIDSHDDVMTHLIS